MQLVVGVFTALQKRAEPGGPDILSVLNIFMKIEKARFKSPHIFSIYRLFSAS